MRAVGYVRSLPVDHEESLVDLDLPEPGPPEGRDLLVRVRAVSVNPVDTKVRRRVDPAGGAPKVLGWDAAGVVEAAGPGCRLFAPGDEVWYAGDLNRPGTNAELHLVDERIVGRKPATLSFAQAAALPLTSITAWEALFDRLQVRVGKPADAGAILIVGGAGGVGSVAIQLARRLTGLRVIATASRPETRAWCLELGAHHVLDHSRPLAGELKGAGLGPVPYVLGLTNTDDHYGEIVELIAPQGRFCLIDDPKPFDPTLLKRKSVSLHWELMFTRSMFGTADMEAQHLLLDEVAALVDAGLVRTTLAETFGTIGAANLRRAHALLESGRARGKVVLEGFG